MLHFFVQVLPADRLAPLPVTFDQALDRLALLPRLFIEPDGSFVWVGTTASGQPWQVDGNLIDRGDGLAYVELKGRCPEQQFDELLRAIDWPKTPLSFQLAQQGITMDEAEFRRLAAGPGAG